MQGCLEARGSASEVLTATHTGTCTETHGHLGGPAQKAKKVSLSTYDCWPIILWPGHHTFSGTPGSCGQANPPCLTILRLLPSGGLQGYAASSASSRSSRTQPSRLPSQPQCPQLPSLPLLRFRSQVPFLSSRHSCQSAHRSEK